MAPDSAELAALEFGRLAVVAAGGGAADADAAPRPAVVTVMGHVDHGACARVCVRALVSLCAHAVCMCV